MEKFMRTLGEYEDEPDYADFLNLAEPPGPEETQGGGGQQSGSSMPISTERKYTRSDTGRQPSATENAAELMASAPSRNGTTGGAA
jgi:hypothetical protein